MVFGMSRESLGQWFGQKKCAIITDERIASIYAEWLSAFPTIVVPEGESSKNMGTIEKIVGRLIEMGWDRGDFLWGLGGGVVTDITGFVAGIYKRGIDFGFVPTSLLGMVDASIGGKNGVNVGPYKNMAGLFCQPRYLLYDFDFLKTLPQEEWRNGCAEIIKHAAILDEEMLSLLEHNDIEAFRRDERALAALVCRNVLLKARVVRRDERERHERKWLNFGHTLGHAIENLYGMRHGDAVAIGMVFASRLSQAVYGFEGTDRLITLLGRYGLPTSFAFDPGRALELMMADKKRSGPAIDFILLENWGKASIRPLDIHEIQNAF